MQCSNCRTVCMETDEQCPGCHLRFRRRRHGENKFATLTSILFAVLSVAYANGQAMQSSTHNLTADVFTAGLFGMVGSMIGLVVGWILSLVVHRT